MKIKKIFQKSFKFFFQKLFLFFYGKLKKYTDNDQVKFKRTNIKFISLTHKEFSLEKSVYKISNGRIYTDTVEHVAIIKDNIVLPNISYQQINGELKSVHFNKVFNTGTPRLIKDIDGTMLSLVQGASGSNYFHFLFDVLAKLKIYEQLDSLKKIDFFYVHEILDWQKKIFNLFEIHDSQLISSKVYKHVRVKNIIAVEHPWYQKGFVQDEIINLPEWIVFWLREKFINLSKKFECSERIYIDRSDSKFNHCKIINNQEVINYLKNFGFKSYQVSKLDFLEQIYLFKNAKIIVGPHGAAFSNIIFCKPNINLIEIIPENHSSRKCERISSMLNISYTRMKVPQVALNKHSLGDMQVSIQDIKNNLHKII